MLWELNPVEVRPRTRPSIAPQGLAAPEQLIFTQAGVQMADLQFYLAQNNLALLVSRNVTTRDDADKQQPFNLHVLGSSTVTTGTIGAIYDVASLQIFQAGQIRGYTGGYGSITPLPGRRVLAEPMYDPAAIAANPASAEPNFSTVAAADGSVAAFVPADRALTWQLTDGSGTPVVRERYWVTFQPGEVRLCTSCHGLTNLDQAGHTAPTNPPQALLQLLAHWQLTNSPAQDLYLPSFVRWADEAN
jgi:hypothetical protein